MPPGWIFHEDAPCSKCGRHATYFCEGCHLPICEDHQHMRKLGPYQKSMNCPECIKKPIHKLQHFV